MVIMYIYNNVFSTIYLKFLELILCRNLLLLTGFITCLFPFIHIDLF